MKRDSERGEGWMKGEVIMHTCLPQVHIPQTHFSSPKVLFSSTKTEERERKRGVGGKGQAGGEEGSGEERRREE